MAGEFRASAIIKTRDQKRALLVLGSFLFANRRVLNILLISLLEPIFCEALPRHPTSFQYFDDLSSKVGSHTTGSPRSMLDSEET
jgi:hypothetical protein